ncbi:MAG: hypothetical protein H6641_09625 [Caldilineaceae bacterium]|nr:hypothetical protein [Caldilineaceae bacterium]
MIHGTTRQRSKIITRCLITIINALLVASLLLELTPLLWSMGALPVQAAPALQTSTITGSVFLDANSNGVKDGSEALLTGVSGLVVTAYDASGASAGTTTVDTATGQYLLNATGAGPFRIEFTGIPSWLQPSVVGANSDTTVQFVASSATGIDIGVFNPADYVTGDPQLVVPRSASGTGTTSTASVFFSFPYNSSNNTTPAPSTGLQVQQVGSVWGIAWQRSEKRLYASALLRRHAGFGPQGPGGVYVMDYSNPASPALITGFTLQGLTPSVGPAIDLGSVTRISEACSAGGTTGANGICDDPTQPSYDQDAYAKVGKISYGDIDMQEDDSTLWLVNLNQRSLIAIDVSTPLSGAPAAAAVRHYPLAGFSGLPTATDGEIRPWGLTFHNGRGYLGIVADAANSATIIRPSELKGYVLSFDPANPTAFTTEVSWGFDYNREDSYRNTSGGNDGKWRKWLSTWVEGTNVNQVQYSGFDFATAPQPIVSDIEFLDDGSMGIGVMDRFAYQSGWKTYTPNHPSTALRNVLNTGDTLKAGLSGGSYVLELGENDALVGTHSGLTNDSPGNSGEFFWGDYFNGGDATHWETSEGALAYLPGSGQLAATTLDPVAYETHGVRFFDTTTGDKTRSYQAYRSYVNTGALYGKGAGVGDIEILLEPAPIEIGNRIWTDSDGDGIQDPDEPGIQGVTVNLYDMDNGGVLVGTAVTGANGAYYFGGLTNTNMTSGSLLYNTNYEVRVSLSDAQLTGLDLTTQDANAVTTNDNKTDLADSDAAETGGNAVIAFTTGSPGQNNHTLDIGFMPPGTITIVKNTLSANGAFDFSSNDADLAAIRLTTVGNSATSAVITKSAGVYTITEDALTGWMLDDIAVSGNDGATASLTDTANARAVVNLDAGDAITVTFTNSPVPPQLALQKTLVSPASGVAAEGGLVIYSLTISNTGTVTVTELDLTDTFDPTYLQFSTASITPDTAGAGSLSWVGDAVAGTGSLLAQLPLGPGQSIVITVEFVAVKP